MQRAERKLHSLERIVVLGALLAVLFVSVGFAQAGGPKRKASPELPNKSALRSSVALVQDAESGETLFDKNSETVLPIASITKLMTAIVVLENDLDLHEQVVITKEDLAATRSSRIRGRLRPGSALTRDELLLLALMASDNRAAAALARNFPGGTEAFVAAMNHEAERLGLQDTRFAEPTGLSSDNVSTAQDLAKLVKVAHGYPLIREYSTRPSAHVRARGGTVGFSNTNRLVLSSKWDIELSKTGYISAAGRCLVMHMRVASRDLIVVLLDSYGKYSRIGDAQRIRKWLESSAAPEPRG
ncbi:MAG TPA: serine hydrolase [Burkholderiales bacterium]|jgi:D-alanyl-D-alanine endopeptidase (penicillin-binding protein 7)|nr:serine hydrolase [Burkholderiales bacterium]